MDGYFKNSAPYLKIGVSGLFLEEPQQVEAILDTGFSGCIMLPILRAFPLGLILVGTVNSTLADGKITTDLLASGFITIEGEKHTANFILGAGNEILLGMEFLKKVERKLFLDLKNKVLRIEK